MFNIHDEIMNIILKIDAEFIRILQHIDVHSQDYLHRLKDEQRICSIVNQFKTYLESKSQDLCTIYMCMIEHIYYKYDRTPGQPSIALMDQLCKYIRANDTSNRIRVRASLCHIYHLALHDYYYKACDLMKMCRIQDTINSSDISIQILYNRTLVQLGLCAFRFGAIDEVHQTLVNMRSGNQIKELLGQNIHLMHRQEINNEQYLLPFHMHINIELIECIYLISAMLMEMPCMTSKFSSNRRRLISKHFYIVMRQAEKQSISGPPETMLKHIVVASHALSLDDWKEIIWNLIPQAIEVHKMLTNKIKEESLHVYLCTNATIFDIIALTTLVDRFELSMQQVSIDEPNQIVIMHRRNASDVQN
ncbi:unnamed protein product, partial [Rotaria sp. Silwood2]